MGYRNFSQVLRILWRITWKAGSNDIEAGRVKDLRSLLKEEHVEAYVHNSANMEGIVPL